MADDPLLTFPRRRRWPWFGLIALALSLVALGLGVGLVFQTTAQTPEQLLLGRRLAALRDPAAAWDRLGAVDTSAVHILLLGVDRREEENGRSDVIMVLRIEADTLTLVSLPRDTVIFFGGETEPQKLNAAYSFGGVALARKEIGRVLGVTFDAHLVVDFVSFKEVAQVVKLVTLDGKLIGAEELLRDIDGLLTWLRSRSTPGGDIDRMQRHQLFAAKGIGYILKLNREHPDIFATLVPGALRLLETDLSTEHVFALVGLHQHYPEARIERYLFPGDFVWINTLTGAVVPDYVYRPAAATATRPVPAPRPQVTLPGPKPRVSDTEVLEFAPPITEIEPEAEPVSAGETPVLVDAHGVPVILSFFRAAPGLTLPRLVHSCRARGELANYDGSSQEWKPPEAKP